MIESKLLSGLQHLHVKGGAAKAESFFSDSHRKTLDPSEDIQSPVQSGRLEPSDRRRLIVTLTCWPIVHEYVTVSPSR